MAGRWLGFAWDETPTLRRSYTLGGLAISMTSHFIATYLGDTAIGITLNAVLYLGIPWMILSFLWFLVNLFRAPKAVPGNALKEWEARKDRYRPG
jgi:hypothetical protein